MKPSRRVNVLFVALALSPAVVAAPPHTSAIDNYGLEMDPLCSYALPEALKAMQKEVPTGERAQSPDWKMEIYVNSHRTSWTVVGTRLRPDWDEDEMCPLARGSGDYTTQKWYEAFFKKSK